MIGFFRNILYRMYRGVIWLVRSVLVCLNNIYCIPTYLLWCILFQPIHYFNPPLYWAIEGQLFYWLLTMVAFWSHSAGYHIIETGDDIDGLVTDETLVLVNHQSTSDVPLLMAAFSTRRGLLPHLNWIMDSVFKYTNFGIVSVLHGDFFINAGREKRDASLQELITFLNDVYVPRKRKWIVLFPEGGFLRKRLETSNRYSRKLGLPDLRFVTLPRMGAMQAIIDTIGPPQDLLDDPDADTTGVPNNNVENDRGLKWVVDTTIAYPKGKALDLVSIIAGCTPPCDIYFHYRVFPIDQVPTDKKELQGWLYARYLEKEAMLEKYYESGVWEARVPSLEPNLVLKASTGEIPLPACPTDPSAETRPGRKIKQDLLRVLIIHAFFIFSSLCHLIFLRNLFTLMPSKIF